MSVESMRKLEITEIRMLRLMCALRLQDRLMSADLRNKFGVECIGDVVRNSYVGLGMWNVNQKRTG